ncbi:MAG: V-type ATP synthase subunit D [Leptotrichiaceae bacterium]|nr:V-type ATP synthase subunit D [Leptotrichiaceae bacterium]MBP6281611.1 V-type ATP synthase subunit D [Leptotrichiaceae bacterium]MBP7101045.1 V-type ATP synthase subunit D [Leptotrichiaceae bacterium]MBP7739441.1 V-type ATP synthase subunit D [Leptotrichiaceae bacterium]MBP9629285.1 V-type ATP synthase subunit D [Leptotrichiaceae bacterium]
MARLNVNPTRMELTRLKTRLKTAVRGHKLLKDKQDELMRQFIEMIKENKKLREKVEEKLQNSFKDFLLSRGVMSDEMLENAILYPKEKISLKIKMKNIMSVNVPKMTFIKDNENLAGSIYPYGYAQTSADLDDAIEGLNEIMDELLELSEIEKACQLMADEVEKTRRRVNALEYMTIPQYQETIKYIQMKLDENERGNIIRLMKVKDIMAKKEA